MSHALILVDFHNTLKQRAFDAGLLELHAVDLFQCIARFLRGQLRRIVDVDVRLYGGWLDEYGHPSRDAHCLLQILPLLPRRMGGLRLRPSLAFELIGRSDLLLRGFLRTKTDKQRQKMVDGMLGCDAIVAADLATDLILIVSDDDDFLPAFITASTFDKSRIALIRARRTHAGLNDALLIAHGMQLPMPGIMTWPKL